MRIAFVNHSRRRVGGAEVYLDSIIPAIAQAGHEVSLLCEDDQADAKRECIRIPEDSPTWSIKQLGVARPLQELETWKPDVCFTHGLRRFELESKIVDRFPSALYVHSYYGMCISGTKMHNTTPPTCCERRFGLTCLACYFPKHCGGGNPLTMWQLYRLQSRREQIMRRYRVLIANSDHMARELARHEFASQRVYYPLLASYDAKSTVRTLSDEIRLIFAARMTSLKGGHYLLDALPQVQKRLQKRIHLTMAGEGPDRSAWERKAASVRSSTINIDFPGWLGSEGLREVLATAQLLVYPSIWPEPFGLSGLEAGLHGVPSVAFAVGGVPEWLHDGVNGHLASVGTQPLAEAIARCFSSPGHYHELCAGACRRAGEYSLQSHLSELIPLLQRCAG